MTDEAAARPRQSIRGRLVYLRPMEPEDVVLVHRWQQDADFRRLLGDPPRSQAARRQAFEELLPEQGKSVYSFVICRLEDDRAVGRTDLFEIDLDAGSAAFGIGIGDAHDRGRGYGTDAVKALVDFAFGELRLERVWLGTDEENVAAQRAYERAGFTVEGRLRRAYVDRGRLIDEVRMSMLRAEWQALARRKSWEYAAGDG
jgi:RimJ/RimL family protein N-acetyltransferase